MRRTRPLSSVSLRSGMRRNKEKTPLPYPGGRPYRLWAAASWAFGPYVDFVKDLGFTNSVAGLEVAAAYKFLTDSVARFTIADAYKLLAQGA